MEGTWTFRDYRSGEEGQINDLFNSIFDKKRSMEHWRWEFTANPDGQKVLVGEDDGRIFAHLASLHRRIKIGEAETLASLEVDGMTHPDFTRRGVFVTLGKSLLSELDREGFGLAFGFPNEKAVFGHRRMGALELFTPCLLIRPLNFKRISEKMFANRLTARLSRGFSRLAFTVFFRVKKAGIPRDVSIKDIAHFDERFDTFWAAASKTHRVILKRNSSYLNWRYIEHPGKHYKILAAEKKGNVLALVVFRVKEMYGLKNGAIVDMLALPKNENVLHGLLIKAVEELAKGDVDLIACLIPKWSDYYKVLKKCGFARCPKQLNPKDRPLIIYPLSDKIALDVIKDPLAWFITWGDTDVM
ncbi:MAG: GNAT family N-acetyltransferase [Thermoplasmata archaeon]|nr:MAG: GNAT family N-acetyltransferase [Thermoplasmata archaeon]